MTSNPVARHEIHLLKHPHWDVACSREPAQAFHLLLFGLGVAILMLVMCVAFVLGIEVVKVGLGEVSGVGFCGRHLGRLGEH